jgi:hypothetical protein
MTNQLSPKIINLDKLGLLNNTSINQSRNGLFD